MHSAALVFACLLALCALVRAQGQNPCHNDKSQQGKGVTCGKIVLPKNLCKACKLKPFEKNGNFKNCKSIYDLDDKKCQAQLRKYARLNKACDPVRVKQVKDFSKASNKQPLDYFVYSVCEECCDCIPRGAGLAQYEMRRSTKTLFSAARGNCPAHAWFDICKIWPKVRFVNLPGWSDAKDAPEICPLLTDWINDPANANWLQRSNVVISKKIKAFLDRFLRVSKCKNRKLWEECHKLERAQKRI